MVHRHEEGYRERCEEPGCREPATSEWNGMQLCEDHYLMLKNKFKSEWEAVLEK